MHPILQMLIAFLMSGYLVYTSIPVIVHISKAKNLFDYPNKRRVNDKPIPNLGGIALFIGISISTLISVYKLPFLDMHYMTVAMIIMFFIGLKDDILILSHKRKFSAQIVSALILIIPGDIRLTNLEGLLGIYDLNYVSSVVISLFVIVAIINAANLIDGIDGLAGVLSLMVTVFFGFSFVLLDQNQYAILCFAIAGSLIMFLFFNVFGKKNKIFMGDTGSLILGVLFASLFIRYNEVPIVLKYETGSSMMALSTAIMFVPLFDMARVFFSRILRGKSPFLPDKNHIHHKFLEAGFSHLQSSISILVINLSVLGLMYVLRFQNINILFILLLVLGCILPYCPAIFKMKILKKTI